MCWEHNVIFVLEFVFSWPFSINRFKIGTIVDFWKPLHWQNTLKNNSVFSTHSLQNLSQKQNNEKYQTYVQRDDQHICTCPISSILKQPSRYDLNCQLGNRNCYWFWAQGAFRLSACADLIGWRSGCEKGTEYTSWRSWLLTLMLKMALAAWPRIWLSVHRFIAFASKNAEVGLAFVQLFGSYSVEH